jgi:hypothetical protein
MHGIHASREISNDNHDSICDKANRSVVGLAWAWGGNFKGARRAFPCDLATTMSWHPMLVHACKSDT